MTKSTSSVSFCSADRISTAAVRMTFQLAKTEHRVPSAPYDRRGLARRRWPVLLEGLAAGVLLVCAACREQPAVVPTTTAGPKEAAAESDDVFLAPFISGPGIPVVFHRDAWAHVEGREMWRDWGVPFEGRNIKPYALDLAIWRDGTIIWSQTDDPAVPRHYEGRIDVAAVERLLAGIDRRRYRTAEALRHSEAARRSESPASMIGILNGSESFLFCSWLNQMELLEEYWHWPADTTYPMSQYSFEQFCAEMPEPYCRHLKDYAALRRRLRSVIPKEAKRIDIHERIRWVLLPCAQPGWAPPPNEDRQRQEAE